MVYRQLRDIPMKGFL